MAISVHPIDFIIHVLQADLTPISGTLYRLDTDWFRLQLKDWEADGSQTGGATFQKTHNHNTEVAIAGVTYIRAINILAPYSVEFEDGQYTVILSGSNNNIFDVGNGFLVQNQVQIISTNSAGLQTIVSGSGVTEQDKTDIIEGVWDELRAGHVDTATYGGGLATKDDLDALNTEKSYTLDEAGDITVNLGAVEGGDYTDTQTHDESYLEISETPTGTDVDFTFTAEVDDIPRTFQFQGRYQGNPSHVVRVQAYNHETTSFEYLAAASGSSQLDSSTTDYFKEFTLSRDHINPATNEIIVKIIHGSPGTTSHRLWVDKVNIVTSLTTPALTEEGIADAVWSNLTAQEIEVMIAELHKLQGLLAGKPMTVTPDSRTVDDIDLDITGDGETSTTVTRQ
jgi:hypothetical protein